LQSNLIYSTDKYGDNFMKTDDPGASLYEFMKEIKTMVSNED
jgi:hypothetical protein